MAERQSCLSDSQILKTWEQYSDYDNPCEIFNQEEIIGHLTYSSSNEEDVTLSSTSIPKSTLQDNEFVRPSSDSSISIISASEEETEMNSQPPTTCGSDKVVAKSSKSIMFTFDAQTPLKRKKRRRQRKMKYNFEHHKSSKGRYKSDVWEKFITQRDFTGKIIANICKGCSKQVSAKSYRMKAHVNVCSKNKLLNPVATESVNSESVVAPKTSYAQPPVKAKFLTFPSQTEVTTRMQAWVDASGSKEKETFDKKLAKFIYSANIPFATVENPYFKEFCKALKPAYQIPTAKIIGSSLLNGAYTETEIYNRENLKDKKVTILQDGWSTKQNIPVISHCLHTGTRTFYLNAVDTNIESKTASYCLQLLENAISTAEMKFHCKIIGVGTDNCETMNAMRRLFGQKHPEINVFGCESHIFNLLGQDLTPQELIKNVVQVQKFFRAHQFESAKLRKLGGTRPVLPGATRWNSQLDTLRSFNSNHTKYLEISRMKNSQISKFPVINSFLNNGLIFGEVESAIGLLEPIAISLDKCQEETANISDAVHQWLYVTRKLEQQFLSFAQKDAFKRRRLMGMVPIAVAGYMLHPLYRGEGLPEADENRGYEYLESKSPYFAAAAMYLQSADDDFYPKSALNKETVKHLTPSLWWRRLRNYKTITEELVEFAENLMLLPASTASLERCFSTMGNILTVRRNRLGTEKVEKLCTIYRSLVDQREFAQDDLPNLEDDDESVMTVMSVQ